ncbi:hypothetical protein Tco_0808226 [Tanacetum coccineum]
MEENGDGTGGGDECADGAVRFILHPKQRLSHADGVIERRWVMRWKGYGSLKPDSNPSSSGSNDSGRVL